MPTKSTWPVADPPGLRIPVAREQSRTGALLTDGACALWHEGNLRDGRERFDAAYRAAEAENNGAAMAMAALGVAGLWVHEHRGSATGAVVQDRLQRALTAVAPDSPLGLRLRARLAAESDYCSGGHVAILAMVEEIRAADEPIAAAEAMSLAHHCLLGPGDGPLRRSITKDQLVVGSRTARRSDMLMAVLWRTVDLVLDADPHAVRCMTELRALLAAEDHLAIRYVLEAIDIMFDIRAGRFDFAEQQAKECAERGSLLGDIDAVGWYGAHMVAIRWFQGRIAELLPLIRDMAASPSLSHVDYSYHSALAVAAATAGDRRSARGALDTLTGIGLSRLPRSSTWLVTMNGIAEAAYLLGDRDTAGQAHELLSPYAQLPMMAGLGIACFGSVQHALGLAKLTLGDADRAVEHLHVAVRDNLAMGNVPAATLSRYRLASALKRTSEPHNHTLADQEMVIARRDAIEFRMELPREPTVTEPTRGPSRRTKPVPATCRPQGRRWHVEIGHRSAVIPHCRGMSYLAILFANPGQEIAAAELAVGPISTDAPSVVHKGTPLTQRVLDEPAKTAYRRRLAALQAEIERCDALGDRERSIQAHAERDWLLGELRSATGLAGRTRTFTTTNERARIAVGKAIRRALARINDADPVLGEFLSASISTGNRCSYVPLAGNDTWPDAR